MSDGRIRRGTIPLKPHLPMLRCALVVLLLAVCGSGDSGTDVDPTETTPTDTIPLDGRGGGVIAYSKQPGPGGGIHRIFAINANGTGDRQLIEATIGLNHHDWAPDGCAPHGDQPGVETVLRRLMTPGWIRGRIDSDQGSDPAWDASAAA